jgi:beta-mannosidase
MIITEQWKIHSFDLGERRPHELASPGLDDRFWTAASVPGDVHSALIEKGIIDNPYFGHNDAKSRWIEKKEWWYRTTFEYACEEMPRRGGSEFRHELIFEGLDTFATIYVNGLEIASTANMLMRHVLDVTRVLRNGRNTIAVKFDPLELHHRDKELFQWSSYTKERPWLRKAAMNFGWDWGPRMVTVGIWGNVIVESYRLAKLEGVFARTKKCDEKAAALVVNIKAIAYRRNAQLEYQIQLIDRDGAIVASERRFMEETQDSVELQVEKPSLWWTHDLGDPYLYELEVKLYADGVETDHYRESLGIRTIELLTKDKDGRNAFTFVLNGVSLYAKGANWIPADHFIGAIPDARYSELIELSAAANMNMLRVWAGGIYEKDVFFRECDRHGMLVWQDFAFANALFPDFNREFMNNVREEVIDNVKRLRNHASLALWCGNNEIDWLYDMKSSAGDITTPFYGEAIYHELIPTVLEELDDSRPYWPSSPYGGNDANDPDVGDRHNWQVWHGSVYPRKEGEAPILDYSIEGVTFKNYKKDYALFSSEFGMHASANRYTLEKNMPAGQFYWGSAEMAYRNKDTNHLKGILLMEGFTGIPETIDEYIDYSMLTQAEGLKYGIEHYRRLKGRNSGALVWQLNDSWPGTSWSMIDYELLPKASYYYAKSFFHPLLLTLEHEPGQALRLWVVNDRLQAYEGVVRMVVTDFNGKQIYESVFEAIVPANTAVELGSVEENDVLSGIDANQVVVRLSAEDWDAPDNLYYLRDPKDLNMPAAVLEVEVNEAKQTIEVSCADTLARMVRIDLPHSGIRLSDNYFDLMPGERRTIQITHNTGKRVTMDGLSVTAFNAVPHSCGEEG